MTGPCRLVLPHKFQSVDDPGQLAWPVKEFDGLRSASNADIFDPGQLVWQVKKFGGL